MLLFSALNPVRWNVANYHNFVLIKKYYSALKCVLYRGIVEAIQVMKFFTKISEKIL